MDSQREARVSKVLSESRAERVLQVIERVEENECTGVEERIVPAEGMV
jgi:hypothetical protein